MALTYFIKVKYFNCYYLINCEIWGKKYQNITFIDVDICRRMEPLQKLYFVTLTYSLKVKIAKYSLSCFCKFASTCTAPAVELLLLLLLVACPIWRT